MVDDFSLKEFDAWLSSAEELRSLRCGYVCVARKEGIVESYVSGELLCV